MLAIDWNFPTLPDMMFENQKRINTQNSQTAFAEFFRDKVSQITSDTLIADNVNNGGKKLTTQIPFSCLTMTF